MMEQKDWPLLPEAIRIVVADDRASTSYLQRKLAIGYNQAARLIEEMEARGYDTKVMKRIIALRKRDRDDLAEAEAIEAMYRSALGMA